MGQPRDGWRVLARAPKVATLHLQIEWRPTISPTSASARIASPPPRRARSPLRGRWTRHRHIARVRDSLTRRILASCRSRSTPPPLDICKAYSTNEAACSKVLGQLKHPAFSSGYQASTPPLPPTRSARRMADTSRHFYSASRPPALWLRCGGSNIVGRITRVPPLAGHRDGCGTCGAALRLEQ